MSNVNHICLWNRYQNIETFSEKLMGVQMPQLYIIIFLRFQEHCRHLLPHISFMFTIRNEHEKCCHNKRFATSNFVPGIRTETTKYHMQNRHMVYFLVRKIDWMFLLSRIPLLCYTLFICRIASMHFSRPTSSTIFCWYSGPCGWIINVALLTSWSVEGTVWIASTVMVVLLSVCN